MRVLIIGGYKMLVSDGNAYWMLAVTLQAQGHEVRVRECKQDWFTTAPRCKATQEDVLWADAVVCYSYGMATWKELMHELAATWPADKLYRLVCVVAGVPDAWMQQYYGTLWHMPEYVARGRCFQVEAVPASCPLQNPGVVWVSPGEVPSGQAHTARWVNFDCDLLVADRDAVGKHTHVQNEPWVLSQIAVEMLAA